MKTVFQLLGLVAILSTSSLAQSTTTVDSTITASDSLSNTQSIVFITGSSTPTTSAMSSSSSSGLSSEQLGGIIGGCAGAFILFVFSMVLIILGRKRHSSDFDIGVGISSTSLNDLKNTSRKGSEGGNKVSKKEKSVKRYNFNEKSDIESGPITSPVVIYSDALSKEQQAAMGIDKHVLDEDAMPLRHENDESSGKRLSKYNFLSQAFSQMRTSYMPDNANNNEGEPRSASAISSVSQKELIIKKPKKYQMYSMYQDSNGELTTPPPVHSTSSYIPGNTARESTATVGTLHAPLFLQNRGTPSPSLPKQSKIPLNMVHRDSLGSEVSEYSTYTSTQNPSKSPSTPTNNKNRYPLI